MVKITGVVKVIRDLESGVSKAGKEWSKRDLVVTQDADSKYPKDACITFFGEKMDSISRMKVGDEVDVELNIESREFNDRWYTNLNGFRADIVVNDTQSPFVKPESTWEPPTEDDDLPF